MYAYTNTCMHLTQVQSSKKAYGKVKREDRIRKEGPSVLRSEKKGVKMQKMRSKRRGRGGGAEKKVGG